MDNLNEILTRTVGYPRLTDVEKAITVEADQRDESTGGSSHIYRLTVKADGKPDLSNVLHFQHGAIAETGINGITNEALIAIVIDRLDGFMTGKYPSRETAVAKTKLEEALMWLNKRTLDRQSRGVEGKHQA